MRNLLVIEYLNQKYGDCRGKTVSYRSQEGDGDSAFMLYEKFIEKYGNRLMGDNFQDDFCHRDGKRNLNQFIKSCSW